MELIYDYIRNDALRHQLNALTRKTFSFDLKSGLRTAIMKATISRIRSLKTGRCFQTSLPTECAFCETA